jgi:hypothetical protein
MFYEINENEYKSSNEANNLLATILRMCLDNHIRLGEQDLSTLIGFRGQITNPTSHIIWNNLVRMYNRIRRNRLGIEIVMRGQKKCKKSKVKGHMMMRDNKGRFCKMRKSNKRKKI